MLKKIKCTICKSIYGKESVCKISCTRCAIIGCFRGKLSETDKIVVDDFVDTYEMYVNSKDDDESDSYFQECQRILVTLVRMTQSDSEYEKLIRVTDSLLYI